MPLLSPKILRAKLKQEQLIAQNQERTKKRSDQVGSGMRGDKVRTIQVRNDVVIDHRTGKRMTYKQYSRGKLAELR